ncbi:MAG: hypothetical protein WBP63_01465 [Silvibacterium sp.]
MPPHRSRLRDLNGGVSVDELLFANSGTGYQTAEPGIYIKQMPPAKPQSWREVKQIRKSQKDRKLIE